MGIEDSTGATATGSAIRGDSPTSGTSVVAERACDIIGKGIKCAKIARTCVVGQCPSTLARDAVGGTSDTGFAGIVTSGA